MVAVVRVRRMVVVVGGEVLRVEMMLMLLVVNVAPALLQMQLVQPQRRDGSAELMVVLRVLQVSQDHVGRRGRSC